MHSIVNDVDTCSSRITNVTPKGGLVLDFRLAWGETMHDDDGHNSRGTYAGIVHDDVDAVAESRT